jgi:hypothetical protein
MQKKTPYKKFIVPFFFILLFKSFGLMAQVGIATTTPLSTFEVNGSTGQTITTVASDLTLDASHSIIVCNNGSATKTITLPTAVGIKGRIYNIKRSETSTATISISATSAQLIDGEATVFLTHAKEAISLISDGNNWKIIGAYLPQLPMGEISYFDTTGNLISINQSTTDGSSNMFLCNPATTLSTNSIDFISSGNAGLQYKGTTTRTFRILATVSATTNSSGSFIYEFKKTSSSFLPASRVIQKLNISEEQTSTIQALITLAPNDYVELWIGKIDGTADVIIKTLNLFALGL